MLKQLTKVSFVVLLFVVLIAGGVLCTSKKLPALSPLRADAAPLQQPIYWRGSIHVYEFEWRGHHCLIGNNKLDGSLSIFCLDD